MEFDRPYVVSWNLTYRCNLACEHCYLDAGGKPAVQEPAFADRSELTTAQCFQVVDQLAAFAPECLTILTGGEPLLRRDILEIVRYAHGRGLWVVVGTNGVKITENLVGLLREAGVRGMSLSLDALDPAAHDGFRRVRGAWQNTVEGAEILHRAGLPFIVQTTVARHNVAELPAIAAFARERLGAKVWNLYFLVPTGRGTFVSDLTPAEHDGVLDRLSTIRATHRGAMLVNAKCAPHHVRNLLTDGGDSLLRTYSDGAGGCPAGTHYLGIRPNGDLTPCPYLPVFGGNLKTATVTELWSTAEPFLAIRRREALGGRCGACELSKACGGCRARAWAASGSLLAEDPLCTHVPGSIPQERLIRIAAPAAYGQPQEQGIAWDDAASARMKQVPAFVRGMVVRAVESYCRTRGLAHVTEELLTEIREKMPTPKVFGRPGRG
ncbi:MAG TPA: radical SAM protein [Candidatus Polarisedimenticolaceae bacterium]|nr:radical SAM protein [Candidatus Polarisedimenticolaceae bacterium]